MDTVLIATFFCVLLATGILFLDGRNRIVLSVLLVLNLAFWYLVVGRGMDILYAENGWMENSQVAVLLVSCVGFVCAAFALRMRDRALALLLAVLCFIFSFREVDVDELEVPRWVIFLLAEEGRAIFFVVALGLVIQVLRDARHYLDHWLGYLRSSPGIYLLEAAFLLVVLSGAFEEDLFGFQYHVFYEELSELLAYCLLLAASLDLPRALRAIGK